MRPTAHHIAAHIVILRVGVRHIRRHESHHVFIFMNEIIVEAALQSEFIFIGRFPIQPRSSLNGIPVILGIRATGGHQTIAVEIFAINPVIQIGAQLATITNATEG